MVSFRVTMDHHALDVIKDDVAVASIQCHPDREKRLITWRDFKYFSLQDLQDIVKKLEQMSCNS